MTTSRSVASRGLFNLVSQSFNSGGNLVLALVVARTSTPEELGAWAVSYVGYMVALSFTRSVASMPMMLDRRSTDVEQEKRTLVGGLSTAATTGAIAALVMFVAGVFFDAGREVCWAFAIAMPALMVQDAARYVFFRNLRPQLAAASDGLWLVLQVLAFVGLAQLGHNDAASATLAWGLTGAVSAVASLVVLRAWLSVRAAITYTVEHSWVSGRLVADAILVTLSTNALPLVVASVSGLAAAGALRAAQTLMGGIGLVTAGLTPTMTVESVRSLDSGGDAYALLWRWCLIIGAAASAYGILVLLLPDALGQELLGVNWWDAQPLLLALVLQAVLRGPFTGVPILLRAWNDLNAALWLRVQTCVPALVIPAIGSWQWGAEGAAWGIAVAALVIDVECLVTLRKQQRLRAVVAR